VRFVRLLPALVVFALAAGLVAGFVVTRGRVAPAPPPPEDDESTLVLVLVVVGWVVAFALQVYGIVRTRQAHRLLARSPQARIARVLSRAQRRELMQEVHGRRPVVPGDEPVLEHLARAMLAQAWFAVTSSGLVLLLLVNLLVATRSPFRLVLTLLPAALLVAGIVLVSRDRRAGAAYLRRAQDQAGVPLAP
jgi:hypothetical protein